MACSVGQPASRGMRGVSTSAEMTGRRRRTSSGLSAVAQGARRRRRALAALGSGLPRLAGTAVAIRPGCRSRQPSRCATARSPLPRARASQMRRQSPRRAGGGSACASAAPGSIRMRCRPGRVGDRRHRATRERSARPAIAHLPDRALIEQSGRPAADPRADGRRPFDVYARPWSGARGARVAIVIGGLGVSQTGTSGDRQAAARGDAGLRLARQQHRPLDAGGAAGRATRSSCRCRSSRSTIPTSIPAATR